MNFLVAQLLIVLVVGVFGGCLVWVGFVGGFFFLPSQRLPFFGEFCLGGKPNVGIFLIDREIVYSDSFWVYKN